MPSPLAYGENDPRFGQNAILIFDIEVLDILNKEQAAAELKAITARNEARQKRYLDSLKKLRMDSVARVKAKPVTKDRQNNQPCEQTTGRSYRAAFLYHPSARITCTASLTSCTRRISAP